MERYYKLLEKKYRFKRRNNEDLKREKKELHKRFVKLNKRIILIFDIMIILIILFNLGALLTTNFLVIKENPDKQLREANAVQCDWNGYTCYPEGNQFMSSFFKQTILWTIMISGYLYYRTNLITEEGLTILFLILTFYFVVTGIDFINNLGYYIGKVIYGG